MKKLKQIILILAMSVSLLTGCSLFREASTGQTLPSISPELREPCQKIPEIKENATVDDMTEWSLTLIEQYTDCAIRKQGVVNTYDEIRRIK